MTPAFLFPPDVMSEPLHYEPKLSALEAKPTYPAVSICDVKCYPQNAKKVWVALLADLTSQQKAVTSARSKN